MHRPFLPCSLCDDFELCGGYGSDVPDADRPGLCDEADDCVAYKQWLEDMDKWRELQQDIYDPPKFFV